MSWHAACRLQLMCCLLLSWHCMSCLSQALESKNSPFKLEDMEKVKEWFPNFVKGDGKQH